MRVFVRNINRFQEEDKIAKLDEDIPSYWGEFSYDQVYQTEWSFNLSQTVLPGKVSFYLAVYRNT